MAGDIYVSFGADTAELEFAFALAKAETNALAREMASLAREMQATGAAMDSELGARLNATAQKLAIAKGEVSSLKAEMRGGGEGGEGGGFLGGITEKLSGALAPYRRAQGLARRDRRGRGGGLRGREDRRIRS